MWRGPGLLSADIERLFKDIGVAAATATSTLGVVQAEASAFTEAEVKRAEAAALLERRMAAMEAVLAKRRNPPAQAVEPQAARGPGADLRFQV